MSHNFRIAEVNSFQKSIKKKKLDQIYNRINQVVYPQLKSNPYFGPNIKRLKGELSEVYRFRIGDYCLLYAIDEKKLLIIILALSHRKDAYG